MGFPSQYSSPTYVNPTPYGPSSHLYDEATRKSGRTSETSKGYAPSDCIASTTSAASTSRTLSPTLARSTSDPSVQWQFGTATTAVSGSISPGRGPPPTRSSGRGKGDNL